jgi:hypothetical protein
MSDRGQNRFLLQSWHNYACNQFILTDGSPNPGVERPQSVHELPAIQKVCFNFVLFDQVRTCIEVWRLCCSSGGNEAGLSKTKEMTSKHSTDFLQSLLTESVGFFLNYVCQSVKFGELLSIQKINDWF